MYGSRRDTQEIRTIPRLPAYSKSGAPYPRRPGSPMPDTAGASHFGRNPGGKAGWAISPGVSEFEPLALRPRRFFARPNISVRYMREKRIPRIAWPISPRIADSGANAARPTGARIEYQAGLWAPSIKEYLAGRGAEGRWMRRP